MALDEDVVAAARVVLAAEEVVEPDLVEGGRGGVGRDVPADADPGPLRPVHRHRRVPPDPAPVGALGLLVAREPRLPVGGDGVDVVGAGQRGHPDVALAGALQHAQHQVAGALLAGGVEHGVEGVQPLGGLLRVDVRQVRGEAVADDVDTPRLPGRGWSWCAPVVWPVTGSPCDGSGCGVVRSPIVPLDARSRQEWLRAGHRSCSDAATNETGPAPIRARAGRDAGGYRRGGRGGCRTYVRHRGQARRRAGHGRAGARVGLRRRRGGARRRRGASRATSCSTRTPTRSSTWSSCGGARATATWSTP